MSFHTSSFFSSRFILRRYCTSLRETSTTTKIMSLCKSYNINIFHVVATLIAWEMKLVKSHFAIPFFSELLFIVLCACEKKENENFFMRLWMMLHNFFFVFWNYVSLFLRSGKQWNFFYFFSLLPSHHHHHPHRQLLFLKGLFEHNFS